MFLLSFALVACQADNIGIHEGSDVTVHDPADTDPGDTTGDTGGWTDTGGWYDTGWYDTGWGTTDTEDTEPEPITRAPGRGDLVFTELMVDPTAETDDHGEYIELLNPTADRIQLRGCTLLDDDVDLFPIDRDLVVEPGARLVLCADTSSGANGGVACDAGYTWAMSEGLALSNTGDELELDAPNGSIVDRVVWDAGFVEAGAAIGVDASFETATGNDASNHWCAQTSNLSGGDAGTPGRANSGC
jgi:hypothetical protein